MTVAIRAALVAALLCFAGTAVNASPIIFLVRHAEKATTGGNDPGLSAAGRQRAAALARMLKHSEITAIFTTEFKRTEETAAPIAKATQVTPTIVPAKDIPALVEQLRRLKSNALVVGHGNTLPEVVKALGIETPMNIPENDYSELLVIIMGDKAKLMRLHYPM
jgi:2,3-bisphosphoglycerate-dependent phosphoglycerate mutase